MNSLLSIASSKLRYSASRYRWVIVWLSIGCAIAILLLANEGFNVTLSFDGGSGLRQAELHAFDIVVWM